MWDTSRKITNILLHVIIQSSKDYCVNKWMQYMTEQIRIWIRKQRQCRIINIQKWNNKDNFLHAEWAPCSRHIEERRVDDSPCHSTAVRLSQRSLWCSAPFYIPYTQSVQDATHDPALWSSKESGKTNKSKQNKKWVLETLWELFYCPMFQLTCCTFPTMDLLQAAQWPLATVRTPIFSRSELSPPSRSSIVSVFFLVVEAFASEPAVLLLLLLSLFLCCPPSVFFLIEVFCVSGGGVTEDPWS